MMTLGRRVAALLGAWLASAACVAVAGERPLTVIVPFAAGGPADKVAREFVLAMSGHLGRPMVIANVAGAGGTIGARKVAKAANDGSVVLIHHVGMSTAPALYPDLGFDPLGAYEYVGRIADVPMVLVATKNLPPASYNELGPYLGTHAAEVAIATAGAGSASHLCGLMFTAAMHQELIMVPYQGTAPALADLLGGHVQLLCDQAINVLGHLRANRVKAYAATSDLHILPSGRVAAFPGRGPGGAELKVWYGMYAPKGTPERVVGRLATALQATVRDGSFRTRMAALGAEVVAPSAASPESLRRHLEMEIVKWRGVIARSGGAPG